MADWIRLSTKLFDNKKIKQIEVAPKGKQMLLLWVRLICLAGEVNDGGKVYVTNGVPYTIEGLSVELNENKSLVQTALKMFEQYKMIEYDENNCLYLTGWEKHQNVEGLEKIREQNRVRKQRQRERDKINNSRDDDNICHDESRDGHIDITQQNKNKNKNRDNNLSLSPSCHGVTQNIVQLYEQKIGLLNGRIAEQLANLLELYGEERVIKGINITYERGARTFGYLAKCVECPLPEKPARQEMPF